MSRAAIKELTERRRTVLGRGSCALGTATMSMVICHCRESQQDDSGTAERLPAVDHGLATD